MTFTLPSNVTPADPVTYEYLQDYMESQVQAAALETIAAALPATGLTAAGTSISDAVTNEALLTVPAANVAAAVAGSVFYLHAWGIAASPSTGEPTLAFHVYSGGSSGTVLDNYAGVALSASLNAADSLFDVEAWVEFYTATTVQAVIKATVSTSASTPASATYIAGNASATPVTVTADESLTLNAVMGSAVASSSFQGVGGFWKQLA